VVDIVTHHPDPFKNEGLVPSWLGVLLMLAFFGGCLH
jgi:hypothetical protein